MIGRQRDLIRVVETAYQIELDESEWLDQLAEVLSTMHGAEHGLILYAYDASQPEEGAKIEDYALRGLDQSFAKATILHNAQAPEQDTRRVYHSGVRCGTVSEILAVRGILPRDHESFGRFQDMAGIEDAWGLSASNPDGCGIGVGAPLAEISPMSESTRELWGLVGVHLATAYRLRRGGGQGDVGEETPILEPDGNLVHTGGFGFDELTGAELSHAARQIDRARSNTLRHKPDEALPMWKALVDGRWSLVERYDSDGRRFLVAHPNAPDVDGPRGLTQRERQVVAYASQGDSNARISYSLGLDDETIEALLTSAMDKLGVRSVDELIRLRQSLSP